MKERMLHHDFQVKVSDMLNAKITDTLNFHNKSLPELQNLTQEGISGQITLQSLGKDSVFATIDELQCEIASVCDRCGKEYQRLVQISDYTAKYTLSQDEDEKNEEDVLPIDEKSGVIDLGELVYHAIKLQEPFVSYCSECESQRGESTDDAEDREQY